MHVQCCNKTQSGKCNHKTQQQNINLNWTFNKITKFSFSCFMFYIFIKNNSLLLANLYAAVSNQLICWTGSCWTNCLVTSGSGAGVIISLLATDKRIPSVGSLQSKQTMCEEIATNTTNKTFILIKTFSLFIGFLFCIK